MERLWETRVWKRIGELWKGKIIAKVRDRYENHREVWETNGKLQENQWKISGKLWEHAGKGQDHDGNPWENHTNLSGQWGLILVTCVLIENGDVVVNNNAVTIYP